MILLQKSYIDCCMYCNRKADVLTIDGGAEGVKRLDGGGGRGGGGGMCGRRC